MDKRPPPNKEVVVFYIHPMSGRPLAGVGKYLKYEKMEMIGGNGLNLPLVKSSALAWWKFFDDLPEEMIEMVDKKELIKYLEDIND